MTLKVSVSFKNSPEELKLYDWLQKKSVIVGQANFIKQLLYKKMLEDNKNINY